MLSSVGPEEELAGTLLSEEGSAGPVLSVEPEEGSAGPVLSVEPEEGSAGSVLSAEPEAFFFLEVFFFFDFAPLFLFGGRFLKRFFPVLSVDSEEGSAGSVLSAEPEAFFFLEVFFFFDFAPLFLFGGRFRGLKRFFCRICPGVLSTRILSPLCM